MNKITKKTGFVGVDISKDRIDCALLTEGCPGSFSDKQFDNRLNGFEAMEKWLQNQGMDLRLCLFCMEHTGTYGLLLFAWLSQRGHDFCVEPGLKIKRSIGMTRGKNDRVDARRIADYACTNKGKLKLFSFPSESILEIKQLLTYRDQLVRIRTGLKNSIKSHHQYEEITGKDFVTRDIMIQVSQYNQRIDQMESEISRSIEENNELRKNFELAKSVKGVGLVITALMLVTTNNFTSFDNGRKYACYTGIAPFEHTSGISIRGKTSVSHLANKNMKAMLSRGANAAVRCDPDLATYYKRKIEEGKNHKVIINAISCKLVNRVFAVVKRQTPYVITYQQKLS